MLKKVSNSHLLLKTSPLILDLILIFLLWSFIFCTTDGELGTRGDDITFINTDDGYLLNAERLRNYINMAGGRGYLVVSQRFFYLMLNESESLLHWFHAILFLICGLLFYVVLRRIFLKSTSALISTLLFISYSGKYNVLTWNAAGLYNLVGILFLISMFVYLSQINYKLKMLLISLILYISFHLYEVLIVVVVIYPIIYIFENRKDILGFKSLLIKTDFYFSCLPILSSLLLVSIMKIVGGSTPYWTKRDPEQSSSIIAMLRKLIPSIMNGLNNLLFQKHIDFLGTNLTIYKAWVYRVSPISKLFLLASIILLMFWFFTTYRKYKNQDPIASEQNQINIGLYKKKILLLSAITILMILASFSLNIVNVVSVSIPSRLLYMPSLFLAFLIGLFLDYLMVGFNQNRMAILTVLFSCISIIILESSSLASVIYQHQSAAVFDNQIRQQINQIIPKLSSDDIVVVCFPKGLERIKYNKKNIRVWPYKVSTFLSNGADIPLSIDNGIMDFSRLIKYYSIRRAKNESMCKGILEYVQNDDIKNNIFPLFYDSGNIKPIQSISWTDPKTKSSTRLKINHFDDYDDYNCLDLSVN